jgi:hypothetical protein
MQQLISAHGTHTCLVKWSFLVSFLVQGPACCVGIHAAATFIETAARVNRRHEVSMLKTSIYFADYCSNVNSVVLLVAVDSARRSAWVQKAVSLTKRLQGRLLLRA